MRRGFLLIVICLPYLPCLFVMGGALSAITSIFGMGGGSKSSAPAQIAPPPPPATVDNAQATDVAKQEQQRRAAAATDKTILTGAQGVLNPAPTSKKTLLGS